MHRRSFFALIAAAFGARKLPAAPKTVVFHLVKPRSSNISRYRQVLQSDVIDMAAIYAGLTVPGERLSANYNAHAWKELVFIVAEWNLPSLSGIETPLTDCGNPNTQRALRYELAKRLSRAAGINS